MGSGIKLKNSQDQECYINHPDNAGAINLNSNEIAKLSNIAGFKNLIINGRKQVNQRGLTSTDNSYNQDRWRKAGNNWFQGIEGINLITGKTYTLSWEGTATAGYYIGNATSSTINAQTFTPIAKGGNINLTITSNQNLWIKFLSDSTGSTFNFVQLEEGPVATPFENRPYGLELSLCQRYYQQIYKSGITHNNTYYYESAINLPVTMRVAPTATGTFNVTAGNLGTLAIIGGSSTAVSVYNSASNWTTNVSATTNLYLSAEL